MILDKKYIYLGISLFFKLLINVFVVFYIAKNTTLVNFGSFSLAFIIGTMATLNLDFGFNLRSLVLSSKTKDEVNKELSSMLSSKIIIAVLLMILTAIFVCCLSSYNFITNVLIVIFVVSAIPNSFGNFYLNNFKILGKYNNESFGYIIQGTMLLFLLILNHFFGENNLIYYAVFVLIARLLYFIYGYLVFRKHFFKLKSFSFKKGILELKKNAPYGIHLILGTSIIYIDTFILSFFTNLDNVGLYQAGMRIIMASMLISVIINDSFIPEISSVITNKKKASIKTSKLFEFILLFSGLVIISLFFYKKTIILLLFSEKFLVIKEFIVYIILIILLRYIGIVPGIILTSFNKQIIRAKAVVVSIAISVTLNLLLIPIYGIKGAFLSSLIAHIYLNIIYLYYASKILNFTKNVNIVLLLTILTAIFIFQFLLSKDIIEFLAITIIINLITLVLFKKDIKHEI